MSQFASIILSPKELFKLDKNDPRWSPQIYTIIANNPESPEDVLRDIAELSLEPPPPGEYFNKNTLLQTTLLANQNTPKDVIERLVEVWLKETSPFGDQLRTNASLFVMLNKHVSPELFEQFFIKKLELIEAEQISARFQEIAALINRHSSLIKQKLEASKGTDITINNVSKLICAVARDGLTPEEHIASLDQLYGDTPCPMNKTLAQLVAENRRNRAQGNLCDPVT